MIRKQPQRKCVATNTMHDKRNLIRVVRTPEGEVKIDPTGKLNGRGAYISKSIDAIDKAQKNNSLGRALAVAIPGEIYDELRSLC